MHFATPFTKGQTYHGIPNGEESGSSSDHRPVFRPTFVHILFSAAGLAIGLILGSLFQSNVSAGASHPLFNPSMTPIPLDVFTPKIAVPFVPDKRYVGSSHEVNENWHNLTKGM